MAGRAVAAALLAVAALAGLAALVLHAGSNADEPQPAPTASVASPEVVPAPTRRSAGPERFGARITRRVLLRERPGGRILRSLGRRTEFGSVRVLAVVEQRPGWLGVLTHHVPNSRIAWIPADGARLLFERYTLHVDLSARTLVVRRDGRVARRFTIAIGRSGATTPTGRFAITDALVVKRAGSPYGCCALTLSGRQPNVPQGWTGGDRLAIHGTPDESTVGTAATAGCLRASEADMRWLIAKVPVGALVLIRT
jgi:L,D-transpeptidase catalytic domain